MKEEKWDKIIKPKRSLLEIDFKSLWYYRDLLRMFVYRDFVSKLEGNENSIKKNRPVGVKISLKVTL